MNNSFDKPVPFNRPFLTGREVEFISRAHSNGQLAGDGNFTRLCSSWMEGRFSCHRALLTHSCTAALEMAAILADISPGDEVILPSFTFVSSANAFVLRGGVPVFVDVRPDTLNIDENLIEHAITPRTKAIVPVHYAGVACEMDTIKKIAERYNLFVIEDAAQAILSTYHGRPLGSEGHLGCFSFHETKNIIAGEGGALLVNDLELVDRAEIIREKGTNRSRFFRGEIDKYSWVDIGSSYLPGELVAAFLFAQLQEACSITKRRLDIWQSYHTQFLELESLGFLRRPIVPSHCDHNAHMYYLLMKSAEQRSDFIYFMKERGINCVFHYVPLHSSTYGALHGKVVDGCKVTDDISERLVRLPLWLGVEPEVERIVASVKSFFLR